jgi:PIN domain nuclease of toxin-antitoxin system
MWSLRSKNPGRRKLIVLDTCAIIFDALGPQRLSKAAKRAIDGAEREGSLSCADISLWEIAMLVKKGRLDPGTDCVSFLRIALEARRIQVLPLTPPIAALSATLGDTVSQDPADRLIAATALHHKALLVTCDEKLRTAKEVPTLW